MTSTSPSGNSLYRRSKTTRNLVGAIVACLAVAGVLAFFLPRTSGNMSTAVDYASIGADTEAAAGSSLAIPDLPDGWYANAAEWRSDGSASSLDASASSSTGNLGGREWYLSVVTSAPHQISVVEALTPDGSWAYRTMSERSATGTTSIAGVEWQVYDARDSDDPAYGLVWTRDDGSAIALYGTNATDDEFTTLATAVVTSMIDDQ